VDPNQGAMTYNPHATTPLEMVVKLNAEGRNQNAYYEDLHTE
jgi:hypothetical protein